MSLEKSELKMAVTSGIGLKLEGRRDAAEAELHRFQGAKSALKQAADNIESLMAALQKDVDAGAFDGLAGKPIKEPLELFEQINRWVRRSLGVCISLGEAAEVGRVKSLGMLEAMESAVKDVKGLWDDEKAKADAIRAGVTEVPIAVAVGRPSGRHPGRNIAQQRKAEAAGASGQVLEQHEPDSHGEAQGHVGKLNSGKARQPGSPSPVNGSGAGHEDT